MNVGDMVIVHRSRIHLPGKWRLAVMVAFDVAGPSKTWIITPVDAAARALGLRDYMLSESQLRPVISARLLASVRLRRP